jgi:hypothetical protein
VSSFTSIPVLDYTQALSPTTKPKFLAQLRDVLINVGFLYLQNPPVSVATQEALIQKGFELFRQSLEKKLEIEMVNSPHFLGYSRLGAEVTALKSDHREQFDVSLSQSMNPFSFVIALTLHQFATELPAPGPDEPLYRNICGPNQVLVFYSLLSIDKQTNLVTPFTCSGQTKLQFPGSVRRQKNIYRRLMLYRPLSRLSLPSH